MYEYLQFFGTFYNFKTKYPLFLMKRVGVANAVDHFL